MRLSEYLDDELIEEIKHRRLILPVNINDFPFENRGGMPCRHPHSRCRYMIGKVKPYTKKPSLRTCGVAYPDTVCKRLHQ